MALFLGYRTRAVDELEGRLKIREPKDSEEVVAVGRIPSRKFGEKRCDRVALERRHIAFARNALLIG
jgi:hypothetical protein